jgi:hypothetical protein
MIRWYGKVDNAQVAVYLAYAADAGHGVVDRELYLPKAGWTIRALPGAGVPDQVGFAAKPELARAMLERALEAGVAAGGVTADEVYGQDGRLRRWLETRQLPHVLAVKATEPLPSPPGPSTAAARLAEQLPSWCWLRSSVGQVPRAAAGMPGAACRWPVPACPPGGSAGCWCAVACAPGSWPSMCGPARPVCRCSPGAGGRGPVAGGGGVPGRQGAVWPGRPSGPPLAQLVPVGDAGHVGLRVPGGGRGHRARPTSGLHPG